MLLQPLAFSLWPFFAEAVPTSLELGGWIVAAGGVLWFLNQGSKFLDRFKEKPSPLLTYATKEQLEDVVADVRTLRENALTYATKEELEDVVADVSKLRENVRLERQALESAAEMRANRIYDQVNGLTRSVSELTGVISEIRRKDQ